MSAWPSPHPSPRKLSWPRASSATKASKTLRRDPSRRPDSRGRARIVQRGRCTVGVRTPRAGRAPRGLAAPASATAHRRPSVARSSRPPTGSCRGRRCGPAKILATTACRSSASSSASPRPVVTWNSRVTNPRAQTTRERCSPRASRRSWIAPSCGSGSCSTLRENASGWLVGSHSDPGTKRHPSRAIASAASSCVTPQPTVIATNGVSRQTIVFSCSARSAH